MNLHVNATIRGQFQDSEKKGLISESYKIKGDPMTVALALVIHVFEFYGQASGCPTEELNSGITRLVHALSTAEFTEP